MKPKILCKHVMIPIITICKYFRLWGGWRNIWAGRMDRRALHWGAVRGRDSIGISKLPWIQLIFGSDRSPRSPDVCPSIRPFVHSSVRSSICSSICLSVSLCVCDIMLKESLKEFWRAVCRNVERESSRCHNLRWFDCSSFWCRFVIKSNQLF